MSSRLALIGPCVIGFLIGLQTVGAKIGGFGLPQIQFTPVRKPLVSQPLPLVGCLSRRSTPYLSPIRRVAGFE